MPQYGKSQKDRMASGDALLDDLNYRKAPLSDDIHPEVLPRQRGGTFFDREAFDLLAVDHECVAGDEAGEPNDPQLLPLAAGRGLPGYLESDVGRGREAPAGAVH